MTAGEVQAYCAPPPTRPRCRASPIELERLIEHRGSQPHRRGVFLSGVLDLSDFWDSDSLDERSVSRLAIQREHNKALIWKEKRSREGLFGNTHPKQGIQPAVIEHLLKVSLLPFEPNFRQRRLNPAQELQVHDQMTFCIKR